MPTPITKNDWRKLRILGKAKDLAFADLDPAPLQLMLDQQKEIIKEQKEQREQTRIARREQEKLNQIELTLSLFQELK